MFYNDNNWNLIAQIIFKLQNELDITHNNPPFLPRSANLGVSTNLPCEKFIFHSILSFKALTDEKRADKLTDVSKRLGACGFPGNTEADTFEKLTVCLLEEELPEHLMEALHYIDMKLNHNNDAAVFMLDRTISVSQMRRLNKNEDKLGIMILSRLKCAWSRKSPNGVEMSVSRGINELMQNYYYINKMDLGKYEICNYVLRNGSAAHSSKMLRIAVSPLTNAEVLSIEEYVRDGRKRIAIVDVAGSK